MLRFKATSPLQTLRPRYLSLIMLLAGLVLAIISPVPTAHAASFFVPGGDVTGLIAAINAANANGQANTIELASGSTYTLTTVNNSTPFGSSGCTGGSGCSGIDDSGLPVVNSDLTINGNGAIIERSLANGIPAFRLFKAASNSNLKLHRLTLRNGKASVGKGFLDVTIGFDGAAVYSSGNLTITDAAFSKNSSGSYDISGISSTGTLSISNSTFTNDGGVYTDGIANMTNLKFSSSRMYLGGIASITNSEISNSAVYNDGIANLSNVEFSDNLVYVYLGGIASITNSKFSSSAVFNDGTANLSNVEFSAGSIYNSVSSTPGGSTPTLNINNASFANNDRVALYNYGIANVSNSTFTANITRGAIYNYGGSNKKATLSVINSTFGSNKAPSSQPGPENFRGGGIRNEGFATITNSTFYDNSNIAVYSASGANTTLRNNLFSNNPDGNCAGSFAPGSTNLEFPGPAASCSDSSVAPANPLGAGGLANNGGPTQTFVLAAPANSAIDAANPAYCPATDQRGAARAGTCDIGAFEYQPAPVTASAPAYFRNLNPARLYDSRPVGTNATAPPLGAGTDPFKVGEARFLIARGQLGIPADATAILANITIVSSGPGAGFLQLLPPSAFNGPSSLAPTASLAWSNPGGTSVVGNFATIPLDALGQFAIQLGGQVGGHIIIDVVGYLSSTVSSGSGVFKSLDPTLPAVRLYDSRPSGINPVAPPLGAGEGPLAKGASRTLQVTGNLGIPASASAVVVNLSAVDTISDGLFTLYPTGGNVPIVASVNWGSGGPNIINNLAVVPLSGDGKLGILAGGTDLAQSQIVLDVVGYIDSVGSTGSSSGLYSSLPTPARLVDTRPAGINTPDPPQGVGLGPQAPSNTIVRTVQATGLVGIPTSAKALVAHITLVDVAGAAFLGLFAGSTPSGNSNLNSTGPGQLPGNLAFIPLDSSGKFKAKVGGLGSLGYVIDVVGYIS